jgi:hypothetical protein
MNVLWPWSEKSWGFELKHSEEQYFVVVPLFNVLSLRSLPRKPQSSLEIYWNSGEMNGIAQDLHGFMPGFRVVFRDKSGKLSSVLSRQGFPVFPFANFLYLRLKIFPFSGKTEKRKKKWKKRIFC